MILPALHVDGRAALVLTAGPDLTGRMSEGPHGAEMLQRAGLCQGSLTVADKCEFAAVLPPRTLTYR